MVYLCYRWVHYFTASLNDFLPQDKCLVGSSFVSQLTEVVIDFYIINFAFNIIQIWV